MLENKLIKQTKLILESYSNKRLVIGYSGGKDSHVLLDIISKLKKDELIENEIIAIHVNHKLNKKSDIWQQHCADICSSFGITFIVEVVKSSPCKGESIEKFARDARYSLIEKNLIKGDVFLSAHHKRDQAETFLLQLMRGSGIDGLRGMPRVKSFGNGYYLRPFLSCDYQDIVNYSEVNKINFIEDDSNADVRFNRNFIRHQILPILGDRFPSAVNAISRSADWLSEVSEITAPDKLFITDLIKKDKSVQKQLIRAFIKDKTGIAISFNQINYICQNHLYAKSDKNPELYLDNNNIIIRRWRDELILIKKIPKEFDVFTNLTVETKDKLQVEVNDFISLRWEKSLSGLPFGNYTVGKLDWSSRFHPHKRKHSTTIKKLLNEYNISPWLRGGIYGLYLNNNLVAIPQVGINIDYYEQGENKFTPLWIVDENFVSI